MCDQVNPWLLVNPRGRDLVKFVGLAPSKESLIGALREAGTE